MSSSGPRRKKQGRRIVNTLLAIILAATIGYVGLMVLEDTNQSTEPQLEDNSTFENASGSVTDGITGSFDLIGVVFLVLLIMVPVAILFRGGGPV